MSLYLTVRGLFFFIPWLIYLVAIDIVLSLLLPWSYLFPNWVYNLSSLLAFTCWRWIQIIFELCNGGQITISGDTLPEGESAIVISNHVGWTDFYMIQALAIRAGMLGRCRWFAKIELRWVPLLGWGIWAMGMPMVSRKWTKDKRELERVFAGITRKLWPICKYNLMFQEEARTDRFRGLISFSEATRYTQEKANESKVWCKANNRPVPQNLLYPRTKGFVTTVQHLRTAEHVKSVYDVTIAYSHKNKFLSAPTIWESLTLNNLSSLRCYKFHVDVKRFPIADLPESDADLALWLETRWMEKGNFLESKREEWARAA